MPAGQQKVLTQISIHERIGIFKKHRPGKAVKRKR
jgi:hypothetical protein